MKLVGVRNTNTDFCYLSLSSGYKHHKDMTRHILSVSPWHRLAVDIVHTKMISLCIIHDMVTLLRNSDRQIALCITCI
jgi:hypothetical protein